MFLFATNSPNPLYFSITPVKPGPCISVFCWTCQFVFAHHGNWHAQKNITSFSKIYPSHTNSFCHSVLYHLKLVIMLAIATVTLTLQFRQNVMKQFHVSSNRLWNVCDSEKISFFVINGCVYEYVTIQLFCGYIKSVNF